MSYETQSLVFFFFFVFETTLKEFPIYWPILLTLWFRYLQTCIQETCVCIISGPDCIPVVVLKKCEPELSYILAKLFNKCLKESCFPDCWKVSSIVPVFKNVGERSTTKNYCPISLFSVVYKVFEKLVNNRIVYHLEKCGLFSDFHHGFGSSWSTADLLIVVSHRIAWDFNWGYSSCDTWYIQGFWQGLAYWSSSQT